MHVGSTSGSLWIVAGLDAVYAFDAVSFSDISNVAGYAGITDEDLWQGCMLSNIPIINNPNSYPEYWAPQSIGITLEYLPWDVSNTWQDAGESAKIIRSHRQFLFAMDLQSGPTEIPDGVRWSAPADIGGLPATWDPLDTTNVAGLTNLGGDGGRIIDGLSLRDAFVVYRESGISVFDFIGGPFVWRIRHLSTTIGLLSPDSIVEIKGTHFFIGDGDILSNDGNKITSLLHNRLRVRFISDFNSDNYLNSYAVKSNVNNEIWFCIPESGSTYPSLAYIYNWEDDTWAIRDIPEAPFSNYGQQSSPVVNWDTISSTWENAAGLWGARQRTPLDDTIVSVTKPESPDPSGRLLFLDNQATGINSEFSSVIERVGFALEGLNNVTTITRVYPHIRGTQSVNMQFGSQDHPGAPIRWKEVVTFDVANDRKVDVRTTGELHCFRITSESVSSSWELSGIDVEYVSAGVR